MSSEPSTTSVSNSASNPTSSTETPLKPEGTVAPDRSAASEATGETSQSADSQGHTSSQEAGDSSQEAGDSSQNTGTAASSGDTAATSGDTAAMSSVEKSSVEKSSVEKSSVEKNSDHDPTSVAGSGSAGTMSVSGESPVKPVALNPAATQSGVPQPDAGGEGIPDASGEGVGKAKVVIGTQREGVNVTTPKALAAAKANPLGDATAEAGETLGEVRSTIGLDDTEVELNLDDAEIGSMMESRPEESKEVDELTVGQKYKGTVARMSGDNVFFSIKERFDGLISLRNFKKTPEIGAVMDVIVTKLDPEEGLYELRVPGGAVDVGDWDDLVEGATVEVKITGSNTGGLECVLNNIRGFIPGSHIDTARVENFGDFVGQKLEVVIQEVNPKKRKLVLSRRAILDRERQEKQKELLQTLEPGAMVEGLVTRLMDFGAFIDIGGIEGLAHVSKLSWDRVNHPKEAVSVGQKLKVKIEKVNPENGKISLSVKDTIDNPWSGIEARYPVGTVLKGTVTRISDFGAFTRIEDGVEGLIHISELTHGRVASVQAAVKVGEEVDVKVLSMDTRKRRIALSRKATMEAPVVEESPKDKAKREEEEKVREASVKPTNQKLKGGRDHGAGGEQFGLRW